MLASLVLGWPTDIPFELKTRLHGGRLTNNFLGEYIPRINIDLLKFNRNYQTHYVYNGQELSEPIINNSNVISNLAEDSETFSVLINVDEKKNSKNKPLKTQSQKTKTKTTKKQKLTTITVENSIISEQEELQIQKPRTRRNQKLTPVTVENSDSNEEIEEICYHRNISKGLVLGNKKIK